MPRVAKEDQEVRLKQQSQPEIETKTILVELPMSEPFASNFPIHINLQLSGQVGMVLRRLAKAYDRQQATLQNGRRVVDVTTAVRKLLETIGDAS